MTSIHQIFEGNEHLMDLHPVEMLIDYCRDLEGEKFERDLNESKENIYKSILQDILVSCDELEESKLLSERYPELYKKIDAEEMVKNLKKYILDINRTSNLGL